MLNYRLRQQLESLYGTYWKENQYDHIETYTNKLIFTAFSKKIRLSHMFFHLLRFSILNKIGLFLPVPNGFLLGHYYWITKTDSDYFSLERNIEDNIISLSKMSYCHFEKNTKAVLAYASNDRFYNIDKQPRFFGNRWYKKINNTIILRTERITDSNCIFYTRGNYFFDVPFHFVFFEGDYNNDVFKFYVCLTDRNLIKQGNFKE